jgi:glycosyltransferase involved in cell wall biosynthesis
MQATAQEMGVEDSVEFHAPISPAALSPILAGATASVASLAPVAANEYAVATKAYSCLAAGCPVIFAGVGPTLEFLNDSTHRHVGVAVEYDTTQVAAAMNAAAAAPLQPSDRSALATWSASEYSLSTIAKRVADESVRIIAK